jgi:hypothetical protein
MTACLNCSNQFDGKFCNECGQKAATHRFTLHEWLHEIPHSIFHVDSGFFHTLINLYRRPGSMIRQYLEGKRKDYFSPFLYMLIWSGVYIVVSHLFADAAHDSSAAEIKNLISAAAYLQENYYKLIIVGMVLPTALATFLVFYRSGYNFAEHLVVNAFLMGQLIIADVILALALQSHYISEHKPIIGALDVLLKYPFWIWAYWQFFQPKNALLGILQTIFAVVLGVILATAMIIGIAYLFLLSKGGAH